MAIGEARFDDVVKSTLGAFKQRFERFSSRAHRLPLMLAHALSLEADSLPNGGNTGATSVGESLWRQAEARCASMDLEALLDHASPQVRAALAPPSAKGTESAAGGNSESAEEEPEAASEVVAVVQRQLEQLGYGPPASKLTPPSVQVVSEEGALLSNHRTQKKKGRKQGSGPAGAGRGAQLAHRSPNPPTRLSAAAAEWKPGGGF